jgi:hypothetical protein
VNSTYTTHFKGMTVEESRPLLEYLFQHATQAESPVACAGHLCRADE